MKNTLAAACAMALAVAVDAHAARRDPTQPPAGYGVQAQAATVRDPADGFRPTHLVVVDGKRYLVWRGRRYGVGETVEGAHIERLDESEVWLRSGERLRKMPLYPGIEKREKTQ